MVSKEYSEAVVETIDILEHTKKEDIEKIPLQLMEFFLKVKSTTYKSNINHNIPLDEQELKPKTLGILGMLYKNYWCNEEEKIEYIEKLKENEIIYQNELSEKYSYDDLFKNRKREINEAVSSNLPIEIKKKNMFEKMIEYIKKFFKKS